MFSPAYKGQEFYVDEPSVADGNLITANPTGSLLWAKQIMERLDVFQANTLEFCMNILVPGKQNLSLPSCRHYSLTMKNE